MKSVMIVNVAQLICRPKDFARFEGLRANKNPSGANSGGVEKAQILSLLIHGPLTSHKYRATRRRVSGAARNG